MKTKHIDWRGVRLRIITSLISRLTEINTLSDVMETQAVMRMRRAEWNQPRSNFLLPMVSAVWAAGFITGNSGREGKVALQILFSRSRRPAGHKYRLGRFLLYEWNRIRERGREQAGRGSWTQMNFNVTVWLQEHVTYANCLQSLCPVTAAAHSARSSEAAAVNKGGKKVKEKKERRK